MDRSQSRASKSEIPMPDGTIVTFYSYKGGVGRTMALANIGALLSQWGYKVLCIDWDLEAPGLHLYFKPWMAKEQHPGLTEFIQAHADGKAPKWKDYVSRAKLPGSREPLSLMSAGTFDRSYVERMQSLDWARLYDEHDLGIFLEKCRDDWKEVFHFVLIDSRTGFTDIMGISTVQLPDLLVLMFTANEQSFEDALDALKSVRLARQSLPFDRSKLLAVPVLTRFELRVERTISQDWLDRFAKELAPLYSEWVPKGVQPSDLLTFLRVPSVPYWSFGEKLPVVEKGTKDADDIGYWLETLAALLANKLASADRLVKNRDSYVESAPKIQGKGGRPAEIFLSYSHRDRKLADELKSHLSVLMRQELIGSWHDRMLAAGTDWQGQVDPHLESADVILLLVSADYLASDYCYDVEMKRALERHDAGSATVIPIILRPVDWHETPFGKLQALPKGGVAITSWSSRDEAWTRVVQDLRAPPCGLDKWTGDKVTLYTTLILIGT